jgi:hypothetical protein
MIVGLLAAQIVSAPPPIDLSAIATKADVQAAQSAAAAAQAAAAAACIAVPAVPSMETVGGSAGTDNGQCRPTNSVQPRITRTVAFTTAADGTATVTWTAMAAVPLVFVVPNVAAGAAQAPDCLPVAGSAKTTGVTVRCWTTQSVTVSLLGAVVAPIITAGAGVTGQVLAIPAS